MNNIIYQKDSVFNTKRPWHADISFSLRYGYEQPNETSKKYDHQLSYKINAPVVLSKINLDKLTKETGIELYHFAGNNAPDDLDKMCLISLLYCTSMDNRDQTLQNRDVFFLVSWHINYETPQAEEVKKTPRGFCIVQ